MLPIYNKFGLPLLLTGWFIFTLICGFISITTNWENRMVGVIFIVTLFVWASIALYMVCTRLLTSEKTNPVDKPVNQKKRVCRILDIAYILLITALLLILQFCSSRPLLYYILIIILLAILTISILITKKQNPIFSLIKILCFAGLSSLAVFKQFYLAGSVDIGYFAVLNEITAVLGYIPAELAGKQILCPLNHLMISMTNVLMGGDIQTATIYGVVIPSILITLLVYVVARRFIGVRYGMISMIVVNLFTAVIYFRYQANPTEWSWIYYILSISLICLWIQSPKSGRVKFFVLMILSFILIVLAHQFGSFIVLGMLCGAYLASVFVHGKIFTRVLIPFVGYAVILLAGWCINPSYGINFVLSVMRTGLSYFSSKVDSSIPETPTVTPTDNIIETAQMVGTNGYIGIEPPTIFEGLFVGAPMEILQYMCLLIPLLMLAANSRKIGPDKKYLWYIIIPFIVGVGAFSCVCMFYPMMSGRFGCFLAVSFAFGIAALFSAFSEMADTKKKKIFHGAVVVCIICVIGFANIGSPTINDDTTLWYKDYSIDYGLSREDGESAKTIARILPTESTLVRDRGYVEPMRYAVPHQYYIETDNIDKGSISLMETTLKFNPKNYDTETYVMFREKMKHTPNVHVEQYGESELERHRYYGYLGGIYEDVLAKMGDKTYSSGLNMMYMIIK